MTLLADYRAEREVLVRADRALRADHTRLNTELERQADQIVRCIRAGEAESVWGVEHDDVPHPFPGMEFLTGKSIIQKTKLFKIISEMPKGALLHVHLDLTVGAKTLLEMALQHPSIHISSSEVITSSNMSFIEPKLKPLAPNFIANATSLTDPSYHPNTWVPLSVAREKFHATLGGPGGFHTWLISKMSINPSDAYVTHNNNIRIWDKFRSATELTRSLVYYHPIWERYIRQFLQETFEDGVSYVEARINFGPKFMTGSDGEENVPHVEWLKTFKLVVSQFKKEHADFLGAKIIYTVIRDCDGEVLKHHLEDCMQMKQAFPDLIVGFDLVGDENILKPLHHYLEQLLAFKQRQEEQGIDIPFLFHAGETCGDGTQADENLYDAIMLGTKRIGHGFSLVRHPKLMQICRENGIALERLTASMPMHPLPILLNHGVPVALSSDDPAMFQNMGLSFDFYQVLVASEVTGLLTLGHLARDSITHSMLNESEKSELMKTWEAHWLRFLQELVAFNHN
ncbi:Metallo-dependent hydrolase [Gyrodon lividus]|nr:Metallo-dependent hydrolase [Gyrodon lividus]